jgi:hypothetical protein
MRAWLLLGLCAVVCSLSAAVHAQAPPPTVTELVLDPSDERHLALRSNFGLLVSRDAGTTWDFRCKAGMGYRGRAEPALAILNGGELVLGHADGISTGDAAGCEFRPAKGIAANVVAVVALPNTPGAALAVSVSYPDSSSQLWKSQDHARSFSALSAVLPRFTALSLGSPAALPERVYMTGLVWKEAVSGAFARSDDGGKTFTIAALPDSDSGSQPLLAALDPKRPETLYLRFTGLPGQLRVSEDGGRTFRTVLSMPGPLQGVAVSANGEQILASSLEAGAYVARTSTLSFERIACEGLPCLAWPSSGLLGCGEHGRHGFIVGRSLDQGRSFTPLLDTPCLAPATCPVSSSVGAKCAEQWPEVAERIGQRGAKCEPDAPSKPFSRACFATAVGVPSASARAIGPVRRRAPGCGCELAESARSEPRALSQALLLGLGLSAAFRRRARARAQAQLA